MIDLPQIGYGAGYTADDEACARVSDALEAGYRLINTCSDYGNERGVGKAIAGAMTPAPAGAGTPGIRREELVIAALDSNSLRSSESPETFDGHRAQTEQIYRSLDNLGLNYFDIYMIHWPVPRYMENVWRKLNAESWRAMEECAGKGLIRHIGVSNFLPFHIEALMKTAVKRIEVNQLEIHPNFRQRETVEYCRRHGIKVMAWGPLFQGKSVKIPEITRIAGKYGRTPAQVIVRWNVQNGITPVVSSSNAERMRQNIDISGFELSAQDMAAIDALENGEHFEVYSYQRQRESVKETY